MSVCWSLGLSVRRMFVIICKLNIHAPIGIECMVNWSQREAIKKIISRTSTASKHGPRMDHDNLAHSIYVHPFTRKFWA